MASGFKVKLWLRYSLTILIISFYCLSFSQEEQIWYNEVTVAPSPNAASLGKYGEVPVDKSTGIPNISIPLIDINQGGLDLGISLNYHAGGIKVQEESSWVGLGWSLNAGGVISRNMRGLPDEFHKGFLENSEKVPWAQIVDLEFATPGLNEQIYNRVNEMSQGSLDYEPDMFYYNFGRLTGSFVFGNNKKPVNIPYDDVKIKPIYSTGEIKGFIITDPNGIMYFFGDVELTGYTETTNIQVKGPDPQSYISSWYLQKVLNPMTKACYTFTYTTYSYTNSIGYSETKIYERNVYGNYTFVSSDESQSITNINNARFLSGIHYDGGDIEFESSPSEDGGRKLDYFIFQNRRFDFQYDYFISSPNDNTRNSYRLKLLSVSESHSDVNDIKRHSFEYNSIALPPKDSRAVDHWGYYNNKSNSTLIPLVSYAGFNFSGANRNPNPSYSGAGMLKKIIYPTGGYSEFSFEGNTFGKYPTIDEISVSDQSDFYYKTGLDFKTQACLTKSIPIFDPQYNYYAFYIEAEVSISDPDNYSSIHHIGKVEIINDANQILYSKTIQYGHPISEALTFDLSKDIYFIRVCATGNITTTSAWIKFKKYDPNELITKREVASGGQRIKQIAHYDPINNKSIFQTYDYGTNGYLNSTIPDYYTLVYDKRLNQTGYPTEYQRIMLYSSPVGGLGNSANSVSYEKVTEYFGTKEHNNGKLETLFNHYTDQPSGGTPYLPQLSNQWLRSKVLKESYFNSIGQDSYKIKKMVEYSYESDPKHFYTIRGFKASRITTNHVELNYQNEFAYSNFDIWSYYYRHKQTKTTDYFADDRQVLTEQNYLYENPQHLNPTQIESNTSDGKKLKTVFRYPMDYTSCTNNCKDVYINTIENCKSTFSECSREIQNCQNIYGTCYSQYLQCYSNLHTDIYENCSQPTYTERCIRNKERDYDCNNHFNDCLENNGYQECLENIQCGYIPCIVEANNMYNTCIDNYNYCMLDEYDNAPDQNTRGILLMAMNNVHNTLVEKTVFRDDKEIEHFKFSFGEHLSDISRPVIRKAEKNNNQQGLYTEMTYDEYDENLNITQVTPKGTGAQISYYWSYNGKYLVAKFENMSHSVIDTDLNGLKSELDKLENFTNLSTPLLQAQLQTLNALIRAKTPEGVLVTTFTYNPQVGITSQTDPNGITTYYEYDGFGRLILVTDTKGKIIKKIDYNYKK